MYKDIFEYKIFVEPKRGLRYESGQFNTLLLTNIWLQANIIISALLLDKFILIFQAQFVAQEIYYTQQQNT